MRSIDADFVPDPAGRAHVADKAGPDTVLAAPARTRPPGSATPEGGDQPI
jgi:hypothetical protein